MANPILHVKQTTISSQTGDTPVEITVSELVHPDQLLVALPAKDAGATSLVCGEFTEFTPDKSGIIAQCHGFPRIIRATSDDDHTVQVALVPVIQISSDRMEVRLNLDPPLPGKSAADLFIIDAALKHRGVNCGIDSQLLTDALAEAKAGQAVTDRLIGNGKLPRHGEDAWLRLEIELGPIPGTVLGDGSIDFRERRMFVSVKKGELLATKVPRTLGIHGNNVLGEILPAKEGKDLTVKVADEAIFSEIDGTVRASAPGVVSLVNNASLRVSSRHQISGDIDFNTGNIRSHGNVEISGSIRAGFLVATKGDLLIGGDVQSARVNSHGNVVIKGGVVGEESAVHAQGDVELNYIERGSLTAEGNIILRGSAYYGTLRVGGNICGTNTVKLVGGTICCGGSLIVGKIGSPTAEAVDLAVGVDPKRYRRFREMHEKHERLLNQLQAYLNRHGKKGGQASRVTELTEEISILSWDLSRVNLVPGSPEDSLGDPNYFYTAAEIQCTGTITADTNIRIGNKTLVVKRDVSNTKVCMDSKTGAILFVSLSGASSHVR